MSLARVTRAAAVLAATGAVVLLGAGVASASTSQHSTAHSASVTTGSVKVTQKANGGSVSNSGNTSGGSSGGNISGGNGGTNVCLVNTGIVIPATQPQPASTTVTVGSQTSTGTTPVTAGTACPASAPSP